jgi:hypothetical protein
MVSKNSTVLTMIRAIQKWVREIDNNLIIVVKRPGYFLRSSVLCVAAKEAVHMNDYMRALHQQFYREPDFRELEEDIENTRQEVRDCLDKLQRRRLMHLVDTQNLLREETSLASFTAGFKLAWGLSKELEADGLYSFDEEETDRACRQMGKED